MIEKCCYRLGQRMGINCNNCKNRNDCGTHIAIELIRTGGKEAFVGCKGYEPKFITVNCPNCGCQIHIDPTIIEAEEVYGQYTDTAGNFHWCGTHSGEHTIRAEESE